MMQQALWLAVEIPSHRRAAEAFGDLTGVSLGKSSLQRLCVEAGLVVAAAQAAEAAEMVRVPKVEEKVVFRERVVPDSDVMSDSADGVMLRAEGTHEGQTGGMEATRVDYAAQSAARFERPQGYQSMQMPQAPRR